MNEYQAWIMGILAAVAFLALAAGMPYLISKAFTCLDELLDGADDWGNID